MIGAQRFTSAALGFGRRGMVGLVELVELVELVGLVEPVETVTSQKKFLNRPKMTNHNFTLVMNPA